MMPNTVSTLTFIDKQKLERELHIDVMGVILNMEAIYKDANGNPHCSNLINRICG
jgi:hypothetical protein